VVEDEPELCQIMATRLQSSGYQVESAADGREGLDKARRLMPDIIILDIMLPKMDGLKVCRFLKFDQKYKAIPIVMVSARAGVEDQQGARLAGADAFFLKPISWDTFFGEIKRLLSSTVPPSTQSPHKQGT
jgi:DNA-binding response OmpR family regulator